MARSAVSAGARSTGGCAEHLRLRSHRAPRCWRHPPVQEAPRSGLQALADDSHAPLRADCLYAGSGHRTGVRGTGRGRYPRSVGEDPGQSAEPPSRGPRRPPIGGGFTWAHSWAHTVDAPPPHLRTRARVADVPPGRVGNPKARPQPSDTSATRRVPRAGGREGWRASPRGKRVGSGGVGGAHMAPDFITPILALSQRKLAVRPTRCVRGPRCQISESRRGFALPLQRKPSVRPTRNVRG